jgi:hypothetical protein
MLAIAISLLFGLATIAALAVISSSLVSGSRRVRAILAELAEIERAQIERKPRVTRPRPVRLQPRTVLVPALAAA